MTAFDAPVRRSGSSAVITVPVDLLRAMRVRIGELLHVEVNKAERKVDAFGLFGDMPHFEREHRDRV